MDPCRLLLAGLVFAGTVGCDRSSIRLDPPSRPRPVATDRPVGRVVELASVPASTEQFDALRRRLCQTPQGAAAALVAVMLACNEDRHAGMTFATMLLHTDRLRKGDLHRGMEPGQHFRDLLDIARRKPYVARSYLVGATPGNGYTPAEPLRVRWKPHAHESSDPARRRILLHCSGADNPRPVTLRRASEGLWVVDEASSLFIGIRPPAS